MEDSYFKWLLSETPTRWWHDSADPEELQKGLERGASGVTTNPVLNYQSLTGKPDFWRPKLGGIALDLLPEQKAEALMKVIVSNAAGMFASVHERTAGADGYVCGQVNPVKASDAETMVNMGKRYHAWAPNIAVKLPVTGAGLEAIEECVAEGIAINGTVSFGVAQAVAVAERCQKGYTRAQVAGKKFRPTFCTMMIGRQDDYLRDVAQDNANNISFEDIKLGGLAIVKRAYNIYKERGYKTTLLVAAMRGVHHMVGMAGGDLVMSIHPKVQEMLLQPDVPREVHIDDPVPSSVIDRLCKMPEFVRGYEPDEMRPEEFFAYGLTQRTLTQFCEAGWLLLQSYKI